jgi:hypothetical protein
MVDRQLRRDALRIRREQVGSVAVGGDDRDHPLVRGAGGVGGRRASTDRVGNGGLAEQDRRRQALRIQRVDDLAVPLAPHAGEIEVGRHSGSL